MEPLTTPTAPDTIEPYGFWPTVLTFGLLILCAVGAILYLKWKLPRERDDSS